MELNKPNVSYAIGVYIVLFYVLLALLKAYLEVAGYLGYNKISGMMKFGDADKSILSTIPVVCSTLMASSIGAGLGFAMQDAYLTPVSTLDPLKVRFRRGCGRLVQTVTVLILSGVYTHYSLLYSVPRQECGSTGAWC